MCNECKKLWELYAQMQLECVKKNCFITKTLSIQCPHCYENIYIAVEFAELTKAPINIDGLI